MRHVRNAAVKIEVARERGEPKRVVEIAKERSVEAAREARRQRDPSLAFDEVWCVFDRDSHERFFDACTMARDNGFRLAISNPCVELWLLLHFRDSPGLRHREDVKRLVGEVLPGYDKSIDFDKLRVGLSDADRRAEALDLAARKMGEEGRNPSTGFYLLTRSIARESD